MRLKVIRSGSAGNTYLLMDDEKVLVLDAGVPSMEVKKALGFDISGICGVLITHKHLDHARYADEYAVAGIPVWKPYEGDLRQDRTFGHFRARSVPMVHDVPCVGYLIECDDLKMLYATDTEYIRYRFKGLNALLIEANYSDALVDANAAKYKHVLTGHMSIDTAAGFIEANKTALHTVVLCHLSNQGADPKGFVESVREIVPAGCAVHIAESGAEIDLSEIPF